MADPNDIERADDLARSAARFGDFVERLRGSLDKLLDVRRQLADGVAPLASPVLSFGRLGARMTGLSALTAAAVAKPAEAAGVGPAGRAGPAGTRESQRVTAIHPPPSGGTGADVRAAPTAESGLSGLSRLVGAILRRSPASAVPSERSTDRFARQVTDASTPQPGRMGFGDPQEQIKIAREQLAEQKAIKAAIQKQRPPVASWGR